MDKNMLLSKQKNVGQAFPFYAEVVLDRYFDGALFYGIPDHLNVEKGHLVEVFLRNKLTRGLVIDIRNTLHLSKVRPIQSICSANKWLSDELLQLAYWMSNSYCASIKHCISLICPLNTRIENETSQKKKLPEFIGRKISRTKLILWCQEHRSKKPAQARIIELFLTKKRIQETAEILSSAKTSYAVLKTLIQQNVLEEILIPSEDQLLHMFPFVKQCPKVLSSEQSATLQAILQTFHDYEKPHVLWGVTGSGKTEIYVCLVQKVIAEGKQALILIPEIALLGQMVEYFRSRIHQPIVMYHSGLDDKSRSKVRHMMRNGEVCVVIGTRSAVFSPLPNLGIIIIDEEHDTSYHNEFGICFHAKDIAKQRAKLCKCPLVLGSATPSFESLYAAHNGNYYLHRLKNKISQKKSIVEVVSFPKKGIFSSSLLQELSSAAKKGEQAILLLNRKGFYSVAICKKCNTPIQCPYCDISLTVYLCKKIFLCHLCQYFSPFGAKSCSKCLSPLLKFAGYGTERAEMLLRRLLPSLRIVRIDRDLLRKKNELEAQLHIFRSGKADVLLGTQMIAKGHHFPNVSFIGILNPDQHLWNPDFRNSEQLVQLLTQVTGRTSRDAILGKIMLQTKQPDLPYYRYAIEEKYDSFYQEELTHRRTFNYPPFCSLIRVFFSHNLTSKVTVLAEHFRKELVKSLPKEDLVSPCSPVHRYKFSTHVRIHFVIKTHNWEKCSLLLQTILQKNIVPRTCVRIDFHPISLS